MDNDVVEERVDVSELPRPGFWARVMGGVIDGLAVLVLATVAAFFLFDLDDEAPVSVSSNAEFVLTAGVGFLYCWIMPVVCGRTLGMMVHRCRPVRVDGAPMGFGLALLRAFWFPGVLGLLEVPPLVDPVSAYLLLSTLGATYLLADFLVFAGDIRQRRSLHDRLSRTRVILDPPKGESLPVSLPY